MTGRGELLLSLATPKPRKPLTPQPTNILTRTPLSFMEKMNNTQRFLDNMRPKKQTRKDEEPVTNEHDDDDEEHVEPSKDVDDVSGQHDELIQTDDLSNHVRFGPLGFISFGNCEMDPQEDEASEVESKSDQSDEVELGDMISDAVQHDKDSTPALEHVDDRNDAVQHDMESTLALQPTVEGNDEVPVDEENIPAQLANENTPINNKRKQADATAETSKSKRRKSVTNKTVIEARKSHVKDVKKKKGEKSDRAAKKGLKDNFLTLKVKISTLHCKAGTCPDFALFVKDNVHDPKAPHACAHAGKYLTYTKGNICTKFFSKAGISYNARDFFLCENEVDLVEDRELPVQKALEQVSNKKKEPLVELADDETSEHGNAVDENSSELSPETEKDESDSDIEQDIYNMKEVAKKVSFGAPLRNSESSDSSHGVITYGRGAEKEVSMEKKKKKSDKNKSAKEASRKTATDILATEELASGTIGRVEAGGSKQGKGRGTGKGRTPTRGRGRGRGSGGRRGKGGK